MRTGFMRIRKDSVLSLVIDKKYSLYLQMVPTIPGDLEMKKTCKKHSYAPIPDLFICSVNPLLT
jgi:hypothetical protein